MSKFVRAGVAGLVLSFMSLAQPALATDTVPNEATLTDTSGPLSFTGGGFLVPNVAQDPSGQVFTGPICEGFDFLAPKVVTQPCSIAILHVKVPASYKKTYTHAAIKVTMSWVDPTCQTPAGGTPCDVPDNPIIGARNSNADYDLYLIKGVHTSTLGFDTPDSQSATGVNPEITALALAGVVDNTGAGDVSLVAVPYMPLGVAINLKAELVPGEACTSCGGGGGGGGGPLFSGADPSSPASPRYQIYVPDAANDNGGQQNGEFSIGFNPFSGNIMAFSVTFPGRIYRLTPGEKNGLPESAPAIWADASSEWVNVPQGVGDPILWTDQETGRTFAADNTVGPNPASAYAYSDDDGATWNYASLGVSGADHETIGSGPYPATGAGAQFEQVARAAGYVGKSDGKGRATYFCSQDAATGTGNVFVLPTAGCVRSDDGGRSWGPMQIAYDGQPCAWLHGHLHVAPDGTAYLPIKDCGGVQGFTYSTDAGTTWTQVQMAGTTLQSPGGSDPSIGIDADNTLYNCYVNADSATQGHAYVQVGKRNGTNFTWGHPIDLGASHGIVNASFAEAIGGDAGRAACGFLGTEKAGNYQALDFPGAWYLYIATTKDGGKTWTTVNATPDDPVQGAGGIWQQGGSPHNRNLLDFNEITMDDKGRVIFGYDDGCVTSGCIADPSQNDFAARMRVARQTGGITLKAAGDSLANASAPGKPYLTVSADGSRLNWVAPDNGGSDISAYTITRTPIAGGAAQTLHPTPVTKTSFPLAAADSGLYVYTVKGSNATGAGASSNSVSPGGTVQTTTESACVIPGVTVLTDPSSDDKPPLPTASSGQGDILSLQAAEPAPDNKLVFTMKVRSLQSLPPNINWFVKFNDPTKRSWFVSMSTDEQSAVSFAYGDYNAANPGVSQSAANSAAATAGSGYDQGTGTITLSVLKSEIDPKNQTTGGGAGGSGQSGGLKPNDTIESVSATSYQLVGLSFAGGSLQTIDNTTTGSFKLRTAVLCDAPPTATLAATTPTTGAATLTVNFTASGSDSNVGVTISSYTFHFGDGSADQTVAADSTTHQAVVSHPYANPSDTPYSASVTANASDGKTGNSSPVPITVTTSNGGGSGVIAVRLRVNPASIDVTNSAQSVTFTADAVDSANGAVLKYTYFYGDGNNSGLVSTPQITYSYPQGTAATYHAYVVVSDQYNQYSQANTDEKAVVTVNVVKGTVATLAKLTDSLNPMSGTAPVVVSFDASGSTRATGTDHTLYTFDLGVGGAPVSNNTGHTTYTYQAPSDNYIVTVTVNDLDSQGNSLGTNSASVSFAVSAANVVVTTARLNVSPTTVAIGSPVNFDGSQSFAGDGASITGFSFDFGDGSAVVTHPVPDGTAASGIAQYATASHIYTALGSYIPELTITDSKGKTAHIKSAVAVAPTSAAAPAKHGGALGLLTLLPLMGLGFLRRRRARMAG